MSKDRPRFSRLGVLAPAALSACIDASVLAAPAAGAILSTVLKELSKAFMLKKWFHGVMTAEEAETLLMQRGKNGSYLVRESQTHPGEFVLSVRVRGRVSHVMIRKEQNKYHVGSGETFEDLTGLIEHCRSYPLTETSGDVLRLQQPVSGPSMAAPENPLSQEDHVMGQATGAGPSGRSSRGKAVGNHLEPSVCNGFYGDFIGGGLEAEFKALSQVEENTNFTTIEGNRRQNMHKNRYRNVIPYDQTRVVLPTNDYTLEDSPSDYINANFIRPARTFGPLASNSSNSSSEESLNRSKTSCFAPPEPMDVSPPAWPCLRMDQANGNRTQPGLVRDKFYIATQGCLRNTVHSFWHMIASYDVRVIAMVTNRVEGGKKKCSRYWPQVEERDRYGDVQVQTIRETFFPDYVVREFEVTTEDKRFTVFQYNYLAWNDHHAPAETKSFLKYLHLVNDHMLEIANGENPPKNNILCVHCSAGIGRTGTYIALDILIDQLKIEGTGSHVDIHNTVKVCRFQRAGMVQNILQYSFLHDAVREYLQETQATAARDHYYGAMARNPYNL